MQSQAARIDAALDAVRRAQFGMTDTMRRLQGNALGALGLSPNECPFQIIASGPFWRLREYGGKGTKRLMVVAALHLGSFSGGERHPSLPAAGLACASLGMAASF